MQKRLISGVLTLFVLTGCGTPTTTRTSLNEASPLRAASANKEPALVIKETVGSFLPKIHDSVRHVSQELDSSDFEASLQALESLYGRATTEGLSKIHPGVDEAYGRYVMQQIAQKAKRVSGPPELIDYLQGITDRLTSQLETKRRYQVFLRDDEQKNAGCPGPGIVIINTGLLRAMKNEAELAGILGHEIHHGEARHMLAVNLRGESWEIARAEFGRTHPVTDREMEELNQAFQALPLDRRYDLAFVSEHVKGNVSALALKRHFFDDLTMRVLAAFSRAQETAADLEALRLLRKANYDPDALATYHARNGDMTRPVAGSDPHSSHPNSAHRVALMRQTIRAEQLSSGKLELGTSRFENAMRHLQ